MSRRKFTPSVLTANDLREGHVVYMAGDGAWVRDIAQAGYLDDPVIAEMWLNLAQAQGDRVVGPYLAAAILGPDGPQPTHFREEFRRDGPSIDLPRS